MCCVQPTEQPMNQILESVSSAPRVANFWIAYHSPLKTIRSLPTARLKMRTDLRFNYESKHTTMQQRTLLLLPLIPKVSTDQALFQIIERAEIFDDVTTGIVEKNLSFFVSSNSNKPFEFV